MSDNTQSTGPGSTNASGSGDAGIPANGGQQPAGGATQTQGQGGQDGGQSQQGAQGQQGSKGEAAFDPLTHEFTAPEGVTLDQAELASFRPLVKELGLNTEQAQKLVDARAAMVQTQVQAWQDTQAKWVEEIKSDPVVGGPKFEEAQRRVTAAMNYINDPALKELLNTSGWGNNPVLFKAFAKLGERFATDKVETGNRNPNAGEADTAKVFFPNMN